MSNPIVRAFFIGRALAETINQEIEKGITDALSELGKFDAEQRQRLREFSERVLEQANKDAETAVEQVPSTSPSAGGTGSASDLQAAIDELRAEVAQLRTELQNHNRSRSV